MSDNMEYKTLLAAGSAEFTERKSVFIGHGSPVACEEEAKAFIEGVRREHRDARHNCFAYVLKDGAKRFSDDGEPGGTAGAPILDVIDRSGVTDACVVVTRYFGGILLGAGGLVRAYSHAAKLAVDACGVAVMTECAVMSVRVGYDFFGTLQRMLADAGAKITDTEYTDLVTVTFSLPGTDSPTLAARITDLSAGLYTPADVGTEYRAVG